MVCWMAETRPLDPGAQADHQAHHPHGPGDGARTCTTGWTSTRCTATRPPTSLGLNEIGRVTLRVTQPLFFDEYRRNRRTGGLILIDEAPTPPEGRRRRLLPIRPGRGRWPKLRVVPAYLLDRVSRFWLLRTFLTCMPRNVLLRTGLSYSYDLWYPETTISSYLVFACRYLACVAESPVLATVRDRL